MYAVYKGSRTNPLNQVYNHSKLSEHMYTTFAMVDWLEGKP